MRTKIKEMAAIAKGAATYVPFAYSLFGQHRMSEPGRTEEYYYRVWLKHLVLAAAATGCNIPKTVLELGPGDALGVGISALLSGSEYYVGVDVRPFAANTDNGLFAERLVETFRSRAPWPREGWPPLQHLFDERMFPSNILTDERLSDTLEPLRVAAILRDVRLIASGNRSEMIAYRAPLSDVAQVEAQSIDFVLSHAVLEHVADLPGTLANVYRWMKPGAVTSHQFDLDSHNILDGWDGHRAFDDRTWKLIVGCRPFMINRLSHSAIVAMFKEAGFEIVAEQRLFREPTLPRSRLRGAWRDASDEDLHTVDGYIAARKPH